MLSVSGYTLITVLIFEPLFEVDIFEFDLIYSNLPGQGHVTLHEVDLWPCTMTMSQACY